MAMDDEMKSDLKAMRSIIEDFAEQIQGWENDDELYNSLWNSLDEAGGTISEILGDGL